jgi:DNA-binding LacI/PurR family transcriptional regulator
VAERAGVSVGSASQAFGRPELVSAEVRKRVLQAAEGRGYPPPTPSRADCAPDERARSA